jgi:hypothetical protein
LGKRNKLPRKIREALKGQTPAFREEMRRRWREADEASRSDILAFFESDGPRKIHEAKLKLEEGIPTSADLEDQFGK